MIHLYSWVVVCNYLLVILQRNDVVNVSAKCLFNTGNLITALAFCLFGFLTPFFSMHSHNQVSYWYCCSVAKLYQTLCNPKDCSTPGLPVLLLEFAQTHIHWVSDAIQPSHSLSSPFSSCPQSFPAPGSFPMSLLLASGGQSTGVSASVHPVNIQDWFPLGLTGLTSLLSKGLSRVFSSTTVRRINSLALRLLYGPTLTSIHDYWKKNIALTIWTFASNGMSLLFSTLSRFVIAFLPKSKHLLISWLQSLSTPIV